MTDHGQSRRASIVPVLGRAPPCDAGGRRASRLGLGACRAQMRAGGGRRSWRIAECQPAEQKPRGPRALDELLSSSSVHLSPQREERLTVFNFDLLPSIPARRFGSLGRRPSAAVCVARRGEEAATEQGQRSEAAWERGGSAGRTGRTAELAEAGRGAEPGLGPYDLFGRRSRCAPAPAARSLVSAPRLRTGSGRGTIWRR